MRHVVKTSEPDFLVKWKAQANDDWLPSWDNLQKPEKPKLHEALVTEQGRVCCYCEGRISTSDSHIEHFRPQSKRPDLAIDYGNLFASCGKPTNPRTVPVHCAVEKDDWYEEPVEEIIVSPLEVQCSQFFRYTGDGEILPADSDMPQARAQKTIDLMALDSESLNSQRREAIGAMIDALIDASDDEVRDFMTALDAVDLQGDYEPFSTALIYVIETTYLAL